MSEEVKKTIAGKFAAQASVKAEPLKVIFMAHEGPAYAVHDVYPVTFKEDERDFFYYDGDVWAIQDHNQAISPCPFVPLSAVKVNKDFDNIPQHAGAQWVGAGNRILHINVDPSLKGISSLTVMRIDSEILWFRDQKSALLYAAYNQNPILVLEHLGDDQFLNRLAGVMAATFVTPNMRGVYPARQPRF